MTGPQLKPQSNLKYNKLNFIILKLITKALLILFIPLKLIIIMHTLQKQKENKPKSFNYFLCFHEKFQLCYSFYFSTETLHSDSSRLKMKCDFFLRARGFVLLSSLLIIILHKSIVSTLCRTNYYRSLLLCSIFG